jgi:hypothetical protein
MTAIKWYVNDIVGIKQLALLQTHNLCENLSARLHIIKKIQFYFSAT